jgi:hypothetical protein
LTVRVYNNWRASNRSPTDAGDKGSCLPSADADGVRLGSLTIVADIDIVITLRAAIGADPNLMC